MADKKQKKEKSNPPNALNYPIRAVFQIGTLAGCIAFIILYINKSADLTTILFRSFLVFIGFSMAGGIIMVVFFSILLTNRQHEEDLLKEQEEKKGRERIESEADNHNDFEKEEEESAQ